MQIAMLIMTTIAIALAVFVAIDDPKFYKKKRQ